MSRIEPPSEEDVLAAAATVEALSRWCRIQPADPTPDVQKCQQDRWSAVQLSLWASNMYGKRAGAAVGRQ